MQSRSVCVFEGGGRAIRREREREGEREREREIKRVLAYLAVDHSRGQMHTSIDYTIESR